MIRQFHRNESAWNVRSRGTKVPQQRMFQGTKVLGTFAPEERKFHRSESSKQRVFPGTKVLSMIFSLPGTKVQRNEKAWNPFVKCADWPHAPYINFWKFCLDNVCLSHHVVCHSVPCHKGHFSVLSFLGRPHNGAVVPLCAVAVMLKHACNARKLDQR